MPHPSRSAHQPRRQLLRRLAAALPLALLGTPLLAQSDWPTRTVTIVVPFSAGGSTDVVARLDLIGAEPVGSTPDALAAHLAAESARWTKLIAARGIKID